MSNSQRSIRVFLCHASTDKPLVRVLYKRLIADGIDVWLDEEKLIAGQDWQLEIKKAVHASDIVIVCLSKNSISKDGYVHKEIRLALDVADEKPEGTIFIIPARLEECNVPDRLRELHWVDLFKQDGYERLLRALRWSRPDNNSAPPTFMKMLVTGGKGTVPEVLQLAYLVGHQVISRKHILLNNGSDGVDKATAEGALAACGSHGLDPNGMLQVIRPQISPVPSFNFGYLQIIGRDFNERHYFVIRESAAVILLGGGDGTRKIARRAQLLQKPIIPIGIGAKDETAVQLWYEMWEGCVSDLPFIPIGQEELQKIGPGQHDFEEVALSAVLIAERLGLVQITG